MSSIEPLRSHGPDAPVGAGETVGGVDRARLLALAAVLATLGTGLQVLYHLVDVVGDPTRFLAIVAVTLLVATVAGRLVRPAVALVAGSLLLAVGLTWYATRLSGDPALVAMVVDTVEFLAGKSVLQISGVRYWVLGVTPAPVFVTWYFAVRRRYVAAVAVAGGTLGFFVLTGDADAVTTLTGVVAGAAAIALGDADRRREPVASAETIVVVAAAMIVVPWVVSVVPATAGATVTFGERLTDPGTVEGGVVDVDRGVDVEGSIELSPAIRFTVESEAADYWRVASFDRYTGDGWVRTGGSAPYSGGRRFDRAESTREIQQTYRAESRTNVMPAAWKPVEVSGWNGTRIESDGSLDPAGTLQPGEEYTVVSEVPAASPQQLQTAGTDYPDHVADRYLQVPDSTPGRVAERTDRVTANAETPYETALVVEQWLRNNRGYSLDVREPRGDVADAFLFEMDSGYCTYFATTMVTMLRTQDVPARFAVGYTEGQQVDSDEWVVRALNSHAWVEVYFPEYGWVAFDPTPPGPREDVEQDRIEQAREGGDPSVDNQDTRDGEEWTPTPTDTPVPLTPPGGTDDDGGQDQTENGTEVPRGTADTDTPGGGADATSTATPTPDRSGDEGPRLPTRQELTLALVAIVGTAVGVRRSGLAGRAHRAVWLRYQPREEPRADAERAFQRLVYHLERGSDRPRRPGETVDEYLSAIDAGDDARRVAEIRERARYGGEVDREEADEAIDLVDSMVR